MDLIGRIMIVFEFRYSECIDKSAMATVSIHETEKGAKKAMKAHKAESKREYEGKYPIPFGINEHWGIKETEVQI